MADGFLFKLDYGGVRELMQSGEMQSVLVSYAGRVAKNAGSGYSVYVGKTRANVSVRAETQEAVNDNLENNTLLKSLHK